MVITFYLILFKFIESLIVFPFSISTSEKVLSLKEQYSITDFFLDFIERDFYTTIDIGTLSQKIFALITSNAHIFSLSSEDYTPKHFELNDDLKSISKEGFNPSFSSSFKKIKNITIYSKIPKNKSIITESFLLYNDFKKSKIKIDGMNIIYEEDRNNQKYSIIGLNYETSIKEAPYIVSELKRLNITNDYNWSFKFMSKTEGKFIIGPLPHDNEKNKKYIQNDYTKIESASPGDYSYPWSIHFDRLYFMNNNNKYIISQITKCTFEPNLGFIIGNSNYKKLILENYFKELIDNNICQIEKTEITKYNKSYIFYGTNGVYDFFTCDKNKFISEKNNYKQKFMPLLFDSARYNYTFNLSDNDLFMEINNKYYFLVAFPENINETFYIHCFLGLPFYQKYRLVFNFDSKTIGFYNNYIEDEDEDNSGNNGNTKNKSKGKNYVRIIVEVVICFFLIVIAFFVGKIINEKRKKRANELNDDNYEYITGNSNDIT